MDIQLIIESFPKLIAAVPTTLALAFISLLIGFVVSVPVALMRLSKNRIVSSVAYGYVYLIRSTPLLVQMFLIYYGSAQFRGFLTEIGLWSSFREPWFCAILALALNTAAYTSEIIRGGIQAVPLGQIEAARAVGMSTVLQFRRIVFPIAIRQALPAYGNEVMLIIKSTSLASTITIVEVTGLAKQIISATYSPVEVFIVAGAIYLSITFVVSRLVMLAEWWLNPHMRARVGGTAPKAAETH
ncbi:nopaline ABC transporter permease NocQ [Agrobacterium vitis]|uniref:ABC transporter, membrane spanning protein (Nopaline) n=5 Tax=Rhizobium/Agrobacterium group TaxID=227290 RepID=A0A4P8DK19_RHIRH|nr:MULTISPECIES: nopaline ABC transporter permease NocM [Rhizobium/Agrobacterium group]MCF1501381.1 nopaline ABC transporter permease NocQ [Allorhizobium sp. Av2]ASK43030.1 ABC transporter permease [Agrobacterium deltaense]AYM84917.1 octopine/nopaline transport system permease protein [Agrobacterium tumefaciens]MCF1455304.1 nopaline ABC transporter permease NocQ [Agrobacterium vitis]MCM2443094.1 nopaline ABC transporter permease NocQ [Agrobacterium vitis]